MAINILTAHGTLPTMAQKYKAPMWEVPNLPDLGEEKNTIKGNAGSYYETRKGYLKLADEVVERLELL